MAGMTLGSSRPRLTLREVAAEANVSVKTVSRVLNQERYVSAEKREQVLAAVERLQFRPNVQARRLKRNRDQSYEIGLLYDNPTAHYISPLLVGTLERCDDYGYRLTVECLPSERESAGLEIDAALAARHDLDGVILTPPLSDNLDLLDRLEAAGHSIIRIVPFLELDRTPYVLMNDKKAARNVTQHLIELGHERIAHIGGDPRHGSSHARLAGFSEAMAEAGLYVHDDLLLSADYTFRTGADRADALLNRPDRPTAIFAANDEMALAVLFVAQRYGLRIPEDLSVAGFDDLPFATIVEPRLTTIRQPLEEMARAAAGLLIDLKEGRAPEPSPSGRQAIEVEFDFIARASTGPAPQG